jgi:hypothetical protein
LRRLLFPCEIPCKIVQFSRIFLKMQGYLWIIWVKLAEALWIIGAKIRQLIAAEGSHLFLTMCFSRNSPFPVGRVMYSRTTTRFYLHVRMFVCLYGWSDLWRFLTSQKFKKITYSRSRFDFPNTLVETHEHHHGLLLFVNNMPLVCCKF